MNLIPAPVGRIRGDEIFVKKVSGRSFSMDYISSLLRFDPEETNFHGIILRSSFVVLIFVNFMKVTVLMVTRRC